MYYYIQCGIGGDFFDMGKNEKRVLIKNIYLVGVNTLWYISHLVPFCASLYLMTARFWHANPSVAGNPLNRAFALEFDTEFYNFFYTVALNTPGRVMLEGVFNERWLTCAVTKIYARPIPCNRSNVDWLRTSTIKKWRRLINILMNASITNKSLFNCRYERNKF